MVGGVQPLGIGVEAAEAEGVEGPGDEAPQVA